MSVAAQRISRVLTLKAAHCSWVWFMAVYSSVDASDISSVNFSFITVGPSFSSLHPYAFCCLEACSESFCSVILKKFTQLFKRHKVLTSIPNSEHQIERFNMGCTHTNASIIPAVRVVCLVMAAALSIPMSHSKPVTSLQRVSFH